MKTKQEVIKEIDSLVGFFEDIHSCDEENNIELPNNAGFGCSHMFNAEKALNYVVDNLK